MTTAERLMAAYRAAWEHRAATGEAAPAVLRTEIDRAVGAEELSDEAVAAIVDLLRGAWSRGTPPDRLWRPLLAAEVRSTVGTVKSLLQLLRTPRELKRPRGLIEVCDARDGDEEELGYALVTSLPFHIGPTTPDVLAWAWSIAYDGEDPAVDVPVWVDVVDASGSAVVMVGVRRAGTTTVPAGTYAVLRWLDRRKKRCILDGTLELRRRTDGQVVVEELTAELP
ncbi:hypothetical protein [Mumia sp. DW29H23]|uniref:hypothetical protein n=1 Tax=Mumia sp. DW29H23 TaxID=3421241 RepID=UPI003D680132